MKKITFMLLASATIFLASCTTGAEKTETTSTDSTAVVSDSTSCDSTCVSVDTDTVVK
jgi:outer membrane biogenesis lipoprotein LolB